MRAPRKLCTGDLLFNGTVKLSANASSALQRKCCNISTRLCSRVSCSYYVPRHRHIPGTSPDHCTLCCTPSVAQYTLIQRGTFRTMQTSLNMSESSAGRHVGHSKSNLLQSLGGFCVPPQPTVVDKDASSRQNCSESFLVLRLHPSKIMLAVSNTQNHH